MTLRVLTVYAGVVAAATASAQSMRRGEVRGDVVSLTVDDPRPLAEAARTLEELCGCPISYEDSPILSKGDTEERMLPGASRPANMRRGGRLTLQMRLDGEQLSAKVPAAVSALRQQHDAFGLPGRFRVVTTEKRTVIIPEPEPGSGLDAGTVALLDRTVQVRDGRQTLESALESMLKDVAGNGPYGAGFGMVPRAALSAVTVDLRGGARVARDLLEDLLSRVPDRRYSWRLMFNAPGRRFLLNIRQVTPAKNDVR